MIEKFFAPSVLLARINSDSLSFNTSALEIRAIPIHPVIINAKTIDVIPGGSTSPNSVTTTRVGIPFKISMNLCMTISTLPPK